MAQEVDREDFLDGRDAQDVGRRLALTREVLGLRQYEFAEGAGIKRSMYNHIEAGKNLITPERAHMLCDTYKLTFDWIYRGDASSMEYRLADAIMKAYRARQKRTPL